jgi:imidazolonepropionase-like amidohydrolase
MPISLTSLTRPLLLVSVAALPPTATAANLLIRDITVVSPELGAPLPHQDVLIGGTQILAVQPTGQPVQAARTIDGRGRYLIPGLIDSHVHLDHATGLKRRYTSDFDALYDAFQRQQPRSYLYYGYTTLVENNGDPAVDRRFDAAPLHPQRAHCGPALPLSNDFLATDFDSTEDFLAAFPNFLHDRHTTSELPAGLDPREHTPAVTVARVAATGARCVKLYYEEALWWPGPQRPEFALPSEAIVKEVVAEAHARGLTVLLHGNTPSAHRFGLDTGVDVMAHGLWDWPGATQGWADIPADVLATVDAVAASPMRVQPTWMTVAGTASMFDDGQLDDPRLMKVLPADYLSYLRGGAQQARPDYVKMFGPALSAAHARGDSVSAEPAEIVATYLRRYRQVLRHQHRAGAHFLLGTDTAVGTPGWGNPPGLSGYREMRAWVDAGLDLPTVLRAATLDNARAFGLEREIGSVEAGKRADLVLLAASPLERVDAYDSIEQVILAGQLIERESLAADGPAAAGAPVGRRDRDRLRRLLGTTIVRPWVTR